MKPNLKLIMLSGLLFSGLLISTKGVECTDITGDCEASCTESGEEGSLHWTGCSAQYTMPFGPAADPTYNNTHEAAWKCGMEMTGDQVDNETGCDSPAPNAQECGVAADDPFCTPPKNGQ